MFLYIIEQLDEFEEISSYKIGVSKNPQSRLRGLQTSNPNELKLIFAYETPDKGIAHFLERTCHEQFSPYRKKGEWFEVPNYFMKGFLVDVEHQLNWEKENPKKAQEQMNFGLYNVLLSEKYSTINVIVENWKWRMHNIKNNFGEEGVTEFKNTFLSEVDLNQQEKVEIEKFFDNLSIE